MPVHPGHTNGEVLNSPTINANVAGVTLVAGWPGDARAIPGVPWGVEPGDPGEFIPDDATIPADLEALNALRDLGQTDHWEFGDYVELDDESKAYWDGTEWKVGESPGPPPGTIAGTVLDEQEAAIEGATVSAGEGLSDTTDSSGEYLIVDVPPGVYTVTAAKAGYVTGQVEDVAVTSGEDVTDIDFELAADL